MIYQISELRDVILATGLQSPTTTLKIGKRKTITIITSVTYAGFKWFSSSQGVNHAC